MKKILIFILLVVMIGACKKETGTLQFYANGEDFVRQGFVSKDGWEISFDNIFINIVGVKAFQTDPPYDAHENSLKVVSEVEVPGEYVVDLAQGDENADPIMYAEIKEAKTGHYNAIHFELKNSADSRLNGSSLVIIGNAKKDDKSIDFKINIKEEYVYTCGEFIGDERKGFLQENSTAGLESTFHFDHIFGDAELEADDELNVSAPGFEVFTKAIENGMIDVDMTGLKDKLEEEEYLKIVDILPTLGHVGEGHCHCE